MKNIVDVAGVGYPLCVASLETADHLVFRCPFAHGFWRAVWVPLVTLASVDRLHDLDVSAAIGDASTARLSCCAVGGYRSIGTGWSFATMTRPLLSPCRA